MTPFIDKRFPVTCPYGVTRVTGIHQGQDHGCPRGTPLVSPEPGYVQYGVVRQHGDYHQDLVWKDGKWWPYSRYYEWWAGGLCILWGQQYTHVFLHIDPSWIYDHCKTLELSKHRKPGVWTDYVISEVNWSPAWTGEGNLIAVTGVSGYDEAPHVHYQLMSPGKSAHQVLDPRTVWAP